MFFSFGVDWWYHFWNLCYLSIALHTLGKYCLFIHFLADLHLLSLFGSRWHLVGFFTENVQILFRGGNHKIHLGVIFSYFWFILQGGYLGRDVIDVFNAGRFMMQLRRHGSLTWFCVHFLENALDCRPYDRNDRPLVRFFLEQTHQELFYRRSYTLIPHPKWHFQYFAEDFLVVLARIEGRAVEHLVQDDPQGPHIDRIGVIVELCLLGSDVLLGSGYGLHYDFLGAQSEIGQLY